MSSDFTEDLIYLDQQIEKTVETLQTYYGLEQSVRKLFAYIATQHSDEGMSWEELELVNEVQRWLMSLTRRRNECTPSLTPSEVSSETPK